MKSTCRVSKLPVPEPPPHTQTHTHSLTPPYPLDCSLYSLGPRDTHSSSISMHTVVYPASGWQQWLLAHYQTPSPRVIRGWGRNEQVTGLEASATPRDMNPPTPFTVHWWYHHSLVGHVWIWTSLQLVSMQTSMIMIVLCFIFRQAGFGLSMGRWDGNVQETLWNIDWGSGEIETWGIIWEPASLRWQWWHVDKWKYYGRECSERKHTSCRPWGVTYILGAGRRGREVYAMT